MEVKPKIKFIFFRFKNEDINIFFYELSFEKNICSINSNIIHAIPENVFDFGKSEKKIFINLYDSTKKLLNKIYFPVNYAENTIYLQLNGNGEGLNFDIIFKNFNKPKVKIFGYTFKSFDKTGTKDRQKLTVLNYNFTNITINNHNIALNKYFIKYSSNFIQFSMNLNNYNPIVHPNEDTKPPELHLLMEKRFFFKDLFDELKALCKCEKDYKKKYFNLLRECKKVKKFDYKLNLSKQFLSQYCSNYNIEFDIVYLHHLIFCQFYNGYIKYSNNKEFFTKIIDKHICYYKEINNKNNLEVYEKILLYFKISRILFSCDNLESLNKVNINYFITPECETGSIINKALNFYDEFVNTLSDESFIFPYLINVASGVGYYFNNKVYTFNMMNLELLKEYLVAIKPKMIVFFYLEKDVIAQTHKNCPLIGINLYKLLSKYSKTENITFEKKNNVEYLEDDIAVDLFILMVHECMGHQLFSFNKNKCASPKKIINKNNILIELKKESEYKEDGQENILGGDLDEKGESGCFIEGQFGKYKRYFITDLLLKNKGKGKLLERVDLFTGANYDTLKDYAIMKEYAQKKNIQYEEKSSVEEEVKEIKKYIVNETPSSKSKVPQKKELKLLGVKTKRKKPIEDLIKDEKLKDDSLGSDNNKYCSFETKKDKQKIIEKNNESEDSEINSLLSNSDEGIVDKTELFNKLYKRIMERFKFKDDITLIEQISEKLNDDSLRLKEKLDLTYVLNYMNDVE